MIREVPRRKIETMPDEIFIEEITDTEEYEDREETLVMYPTMIGIPDR